MKNKKQEYEDIIKYCTDNNRAVPLDWCKVMTILEIRKLPRHCRGAYHSLVLAYHSQFSINQKLKDFIDKLHMDYLTLILVSIINLKIFY